MCCLNSCFVYVTFWAESFTVSMWNTGGVMSTSLLWSKSFFTLFSSLKFVFFLFFCASCICMRWSLKHLRYDDRKWTMQQNVLQSFIEVDGLNLIIALNFSLIGVYDGFQSFSMWEHTFWVVSEKFIFVGRDFQSTFYKILEKISKIFKAFLCVENSRVSSMVSFSGMFPKTYSMNFSKLRGHPNTPT